MLIKKITPILFVVLLLCACHNNDDLNSIIPEDETQSTIIPIEDALELADKYFGQFEDPATRSASAPKKVKSVKFLGSDNANTRSLTDDDLRNRIYEINYENEEGFALIGADERNFGIYAFGDKGHFNLADTLENIGLAIFYNHLKYRMEEIEKNPQTRADSPYLPGTTGYPKLIQKIVSPTINYVWDQIEPFNKYCFTTSRKKAKVGCVPLAVAMILFNQYGFGDDRYLTLPNGYRVDWWKIGMAINENSSAEYIDALARFLEVLGRNEHLNSWYKNTPEEYATSTEIEMVPYFLRLCGLGTLGYKPIIPVNFKIYWESHPTWDIYMTGRCDYGGHAWVNQGYAEVIDANRFTNMYVYMNWGWNGKANGWYLANTIYDTGSNESIYGQKYREDLWWIPSDKGYYFYKEMMMLTIWKP